jgi:LuxR family quorum sensing-dependent transcriptional regulator
VNATTLDHARAAFDLIDELDRLRTPEQVLDRLGTTLSSFGYPSFLITGVPEPPAQVEAHFLLNGWPRDFAQHYARENYYADDPVAAWCRRSLDPFEWSEARYDPRAWPRAAEVMSHAADFGMRAGICVPIMRGNGVQDCMTMAGECPDREPRTKRAIHLISLYAHAKAISLLRVGDPVRVEQRILTEREREVLSWTAAGKSSWEISMILGVTERTVNWFIANATRKLNAVNRTQAVVNAIRAGEIEL